MRRLRTLARRVRGLFGKNQPEAALDEEARFHLEMEAEPHIRNGMDPGEARLAARRSFGGVEQVKEHYREQRGLPQVESLGRDLADTWRALRRHPGYTIAALLSLALGIEANTAVFSLLDALVLRPLPYPGADRLVHVDNSMQVGGRTRTGVVSAPVLRDWRDRAPVFTAMRIHAFYDRLIERPSALPGVEAVGLNNLLPVQCSYTSMDFTVEGWPDTRSGQAPLAEHRTVDADFFRANGIPIVAGRGFTAAENRPLSGAIVISQRAARQYWPNVDPVGRRLAYGTKSPPDRRMTVVGVAADIRSAGLGPPDRRQRPVDPGRLALPASQS